MTTIAVPADSAPAAQARPISDQARDYLNLDSLFTAEELAQRDKVLAFVDARIRPNIARWYEDAVFPREIATEFGDLGLRRRHRASRTGLQPALLQPRADHEMRRGGPRTAYLRFLGWRSRPS